MSIATLGALIGFDQAVLRKGAAVPLIVFDLVPPVPALQLRFAAATAGLGAPDAGLLSCLSCLSGACWFGQFAVGLVLGIVWSPRVGPTLGAASALASQGRNLGQIGPLMLLFGLGAATPLLVIGPLSRKATTRTCGRLLALGRRGRWLLGAALLVVGLAILAAATSASRPGPSSTRLTG